MNHIIDNLTMDNKTDEYIVWLVELMDDSNILFTTSPDVYLQGRLRDAQKCVFRS